MGEQNKEQTINGASKAGGEFLQSASLDSHKQTNNQDSLPKLILLTPQFVQETLETMLHKAKPTLNEEALHQEGNWLYHLVEVKLPFSYFQRVQMSPEIARGLVLRALRRCDIPLGEESQYDRLFLLLSMD